LNRNHLESSLSLGITDANLISSVPSELTIVGVEVPFSYTGLAD